MKMKIRIELNEDEVYELPAKYIVCDNCGGSGSTVNPSIDGNGLPDLVHAQRRQNYVSCNVGMKMRRLYL